MYIENPKTKGSGILCAIPQKGTCPNNCKDCFFQSGRSYLEPLDQNLPNMPDLSITKNKVVRINDGNDSNVNQELVIESSKLYEMKFYNTAIPRDLDKFDAPVVLTINPMGMTDKNWYKLDIIPKNLMFVRARTNMWNLEKVVDRAVKYYTENNVPVILTFLAYYNEEIPKEYSDWYEFKKRTLNSYFVIKPEGWEKIMNQYKMNNLVYSCGQKFSGTVSCKECGNCLREHFATVERMND